MRKKVFVGTSLLIIAVLLSGAPPVWSGGWSHTSNGPFGGVIQAIALDGEGNLCAGVHWGWVYASSDGGNTWSLSNTGIAQGGRDIRALAAYPAAGYRVYAGSRGGGVFWSSSCDGSWMAMNSGLSNLLVEALMVDPGPPVTLYAGTDGGGVYRWVEPGGPWQAMNDGALSARVQDLEMLSDGTLCMGVQASGSYSGVYCWSGVQWEQLGNSDALPNTTSALTLQADGTNLWAGTDTDGVYYWNGTVWAARNSGLPAGDARHIWVLGKDGGGSTYAGTADGFYRWASGVWTARDGGMLGNGRHVRDFLSPSGTNLFAGSDGRGVWASTDGGASWEEKNEGLSGYIVRAVAINPAYDPRVYAGTYKGGVFWTQDGGANWSWWSDGLGDVEVEALAVTYPQGYPVYAGLSGQGVYTRTKIGIWDWSDWGERSDGLTGSALVVQALAIKPEPNSPIVYAGTEDGVYKTVNAGELWAESSTGLPHAVSALAVDPRAYYEDWVYAGTESDGVYYSDDEAASWAVLGSLSGDAEEILGLTVDQAGTIYAGTEDGIYKCDIDDCTWETFGFQEFPIYSMAVNPITQTLVYAGSTAPIGVVFTDTGKVTWEPMNTGLKNLNVYAISIDDYDPQSLHVGTGGSSVWDFTYGAPPIFIPELGIDLDSGFTIVEAGQYLTYTVTYYNAGLGPADNIVITMTLPNDTQYVGSDPPFTEISPGLYQLDVTTLDPEVLDDAFFRVQVLEDTPDYTYIDTCASITDDGTHGEDPYLLNNSNCDRDLVGGDLFLTKGADPSSGSEVEPGERIDYTLEVSNESSNTFTTLLLTDTLPNHVTYVPGSIWPVGQGDDTDLPILRWDVGTLSGDQAIQVGFAVTVNEDAPEGASIVNTFDANTDQTPLLTCLDPVEHTVGEGGTIHPAGPIYLPLVMNGYASAPDLVVTALWSDPAEPAAGEPFDLHVTVENAGTMHADDGHFWVEVYIKPNPSAAPTGPFDHYQGYCEDAGCTVLRGDYVMALEYLNIGQEYTLHFTGDQILLPEAGTYDVYAQVDMAFVGYGDTTYGFYQELSETNNVDHITVNGQ
jgi:uncharacterized repeat protein (TIGR01451 family)